MSILAQTDQSGGFAGVLESAPTDEITAMFVVFMVCTTLLAVLIARFVTGTIQSIRIASIHARLIQQLADKGMSPSEIKQLVETSAGNSDRQVNWPTRWQKAPVPDRGVPGKPVAVHS